MIRAHLDAASVGRIRFAPSPVFETVGWLTLAATGGRHPFWGDPGPAARFALRDRDVAATAALLAGGLQGHYMPDFSTPKPPAGACGAACMRTQLELVRAAPVDTVDEQLARSEVSRSVASHRLPSRVATGLARFWREVMQDRWPRYQAVFARDLQTQMSLAASAGIGTVLASLHPSLRWTGGCLDVDKPYDEEVAYRGEELVLVPSLVAWPRVAVQLCNPADATVTYPLSGVAGPARRPPGALLGRGRTRVLAAAHRPLSTTQLSRQLDLSAATVSHHLRILHDAGLVRRTRHGREVHYQRTDLGQRLLDAAG